MKSAASLLAAALLLVGGAARAADFPAAANKPFQLELGGAWDSYDTQAGLSYTRGGLVNVGTTIDFEKLLDIPVMRQHFRGAAQWRFSEVSYVQLGFETVSRAGRRQQDTEIIWGDTTYRAGVQLDGRFDTDDWYVGYRWDAFKASNVRMGPTIGVSYYSIDSSLKGQGEITKGDGTVEKGLFERAFSLKAPVPVIGLAAEGAISSKVTFNFYARALYIRVDQFSGGTITGGIGAKWYFLPNIGIGGGLDLTSIQIKKYVSGDSTYTARYSYAGPRLSVVAAF